MLCSGKEAEMFVRCAFFKGKIKPGMDEAFHAHWRENLVPLWGAFPKLLELRVMREVESDDPESPFPLVMAMKFETRDDIEEALASPTRWASKETSKKNCSRCSMAMSFTPCLPPINSTRLPDRTA